MPEKSGGVNWSHSVCVTITEATTLARVTGWSHPQGAHAHSISCRDLDLPHDVGWEEKHSFHYNSYLYIKTTPELILDN